MKRAIPFLILLVLGGGGAWWAWRKDEPRRRYARIDGLLRDYAGRPWTAWSDGDASDLWSHVAWFHTRDRLGLIRFIVDGLSSEDAEERGRAGLLAAHLREYRYRTRPYFAAVEPWRLPIPGQDLDLGAFDLNPVVKSSLENFARLADDPGEDALESFLTLADASNGAPIRAAYLRLATREIPSPRLREVLTSLGELREDPDVARALAARAAAGELQARFIASSVLARRNDPAGTRIFVDLLTDLGADLGIEDRALASRYVVDVFESLDALRWEEAAGVDGWRIWLEFREHEDFRADAQAARDEAWRKEYR